MPLRRSIFAALAVVLAGCASAGEPSPPADITGVTWRWTGMTTPVETIKVDAPDRYTMTLGADGRVALRADCNRGSGPYTITPDRRIKMGPLALTRAACPPGSLSDRYVRELERASIYFLKDGALFLDLPADSGTLRFERAG